MNEETNIEQKEASRKKASIYMTIGVCVIALALGVWSAMTQPDMKNGAEAKTEKQTVQTTTLTAKAAENKITGQTVGTTKRTQSKTTEKKTEKTTKKSAVAKYFIMPIGGETIKNFSASELQFSKTYGDWRLHTAVDIKADTDTAVNASGDGKVTDAYEDSKLGKVIVIDHGNGIVGYYCGLKSFGARKGDIVGAGDKIGVAGTVPCESKDGAHLHFEMKQNEKYIDPQKLWRAE